MKNMTKKGLERHIISPGKHSQALCDLWVHGTVDVVQEVECLVDELVAVLEEALLDLGLAGGVEVVGVGGPWVDVLDDGEDVDHVFVVEDGAAVGAVVGLGVEAVLLQLQLDPSLHADRAEQGHLLQAVNLKQNHTIFIGSVFVEI